jgi:hypothetical protein
MKKILSGSEEEKKEVLGEGLNQEKSSSAKLNNLVRYDSPSLSTLENTPFAAALGEALGMGLTSSVDITEGDNLHIETSFGEYVIRGTIILIEDMHVTLDTGWSWEETEGIRNISNGTETHIIKSIGVIHA